MLTDNISFQLYSARNTSLPEALSIIASTGYKTVEAYPANYEDLETFKREVDAAGLAVSSLHISLDQLKSNMTNSIDLAAELNVNHIVCPYLLPDDRPQDKNGWLALAADLADLNAQISATGRDFAWHNHDFEFQPLADGSSPMRLLLDNAPDMYWELDIGWVQRAGLSPASWLRTYGERVSALHLKDVAESGESVDEDGWADVGYGTVNWAELQTYLMACDAELFIVEHDNPADLKRCAERSIQTINRWIRE